MLQTISFLISRRLRLVLRAPMRRCLPAMPGRVACFHFALAAAILTAASAEAQTGWLANKDRSCSVLLPATPPEGAELSWTGRCEAGKAVGYGIAAAGKPGQKPGIFVHGYASIGLFEDEAYIETTDGARLSVRMKAGLKHGPGAGLDKDGNFYTTDFENGQPGPLSTIQKSKIASEQRDQVERYSFFTRSTAERERQAAERTAGGTKGKQTATGQTHAARPLAAPCEYLSHSTAQRKLSGNARPFNYRMLGECLGETGQADQAIALAAEAGARWDDKVAGEVMAYTLSLAWFHKKDFKQSLHHFRAMGGPGGYGPHQLRQIGFLESPEFAVVDGERKALLREFSAQVSNYLSAAGDFHTAYAVCTRGKSCADVINHPINVAAALQCSRGECDKALALLDATLGKDPDFADRLVVPSQLERAFLDGTVRLTTYPALASRFVAPRPLQTTSVVRVLSSGGRGSGVLISPRHVLTDYHVVFDYPPDSFAKDAYWSAKVSPEIHVVFQTDMARRETWQLAELKQVAGVPAKVVAYDAELDVAVLELARPVPAGVVAAQISPLDSPAFGELHAMGFPGFKDVSEALVSSPTVGTGNFTGWTYAPFDSRKALRHRLTLSSPTARGMSGGPVFNNCGHVVTLNSFGISLPLPRLQQGNVGMETHLLREFLAKAGIAPAAAPAGCLPFGNGGEGRSLRYTVGLRFKSREQLTGIIVDKHHALFFAPPDIKEGDTIQFSSTWVGFGWQPPAIQAKTERFWALGDPNYKKDWDAGQGSGGNVVKIDMKTRLALAKIWTVPPWGEDNVLLYQRPGDLETYPRLSVGGLGKGAWHYFVSTVESGTPASRTTEQFGFARLTIGRSELKPATGGTYALRGAVNNTSVGAPVFDVCGALAGIVSDVARDNTATATVIDITDIRRVLQEARSGISLQDSKCAQ